MEKARPGVDHDELEVWRWRLEIAGQPLQLPRRQIPSPHGYAKRCWRACRLLLVREGEEALRRRQYPG